MDIGWNWNKKTLLQTFIWYCPSARIRSPW